MSATTKPIFASWTVNGAILSVVCLALGMTGRHVDKDMLDGTIVAGKEVYLLLAGSVSLLGAAWARVKLWKFNRPNMKEPATWAAVAGLVGSVGALLGLPPEALTDMQSAVEQVGGLAVSGKATGVVLNLLVIWRALSAKQKLTERRAEPLL